MYSKIVVLICAVAASSASVFAPAPLVAAPAPLVAAPAPVLRADPLPQYSFGYDVQDALTGDFKGHQEHRNGDLVTGSYSVVDPDGTRRIVDYAADPLNGFNAVVRREPLVAAVPARVLAPAPAPLVRAPLLAPAPAPYYPRAPLYAPAPAPLLAPRLPAPYYF